MSRLPFLSDEWLTKVDELIAAAGDLEIPEPMKIAVNVTVRGPDGETRVYMADGAFHRGHRGSAIASLMVPVDIARRVFVDGDPAAAVQAFLEGKITIEGDLAKVVAMQTVPPSAKQQALTAQIAAITA